MNCLICNIEFQAREGAKYCSQRCRKDASRKQSVVTDNVTLSTPPVTDKFEYYTITKTRETEAGIVEGNKHPKRTAKYWYDVPLGAIPIILKDWPKMPDFMNGRQYFLWWKNDFLIEDGTPTILNPYPIYENVKYEMGGAGSRKWGA